MMFSNIRTTGIKWNIARLYGPFADLFFFLLKKDGKEEPVPAPEWPCLRYDYLHIYGLDAGILRPGQLPDLTVLEVSGGRT